jgi:hypothetical protein
MINLLTRNQKDDFITFNALLKLMESSSLDFNKDERETITIAANMMLMTLDGLASRMTNDLLGELIQIGKTANVVCSYDDIKIKKGIMVEVKDIDYIVAAALQTCESCNRNWKQCGLRKALHKVGAPLVDPEQSGCKFKFK